MSVNFLLAVISTCEGPGDQSLDTLGRSVLIPDTPRVLQHPRDEDHRGEKDDVDE